MRFIAFVRTYRRLPWDWNALAGNPNITIADILSSRDLPWSWSPIMKRNLSRNPSVTIADIRSNPEMFDATALSGNPCISLADVCALPDVEWQWGALSERIPFETILTHHDLPWVWESVSSNPTLTFADVIDRLELPWDWKTLSRTLKISVADIRANPDLPWDFSDDGLWRNHSLSLREMREAFGRRGDGGKWASAYLKVDLDDIPDGFDFDARPGADWVWQEDWDFSGMMMNPNISTDEILSHPHLFPMVDMFGNFVAHRELDEAFVTSLIQGEPTLHTINMLSFNPSLPLSIVLSNPRIAFNWSGISANPMGFGLTEVAVKPSRDEIRGRCVLTKGELMERAWHPDRVWNWCFDEEEKREISGA
jgi:hypothetical protein